MTMSLSCDCWRGIGFCAQPRSRHLSAARSIAPIAGSAGYFTPATSIGRARNSTTIPTAGSAPMAYALADRGARLLIAARRPSTSPTSNGAARTAKPAGRSSSISWRPWISMSGCSRRVRSANDLRLIHPDELVAAFPDQSFNARNPFALHVKVSHARCRPRRRRRARFGVRLGVRGRLAALFSGRDRSRHHADHPRRHRSQTSLERKMRGYLAAHATSQHERRFGWRTFRVLDGDHRSAARQIGTRGSAPHPSRRIVRVRRCFSSPRAPT